ncbi:MAG: GNAT family protein [Bacteroidota bacterium]
MMDQLFPFETARLRIRKLRLEDVGAFHAYRRLPQVCQYQGFYPMDEQACAAFIEEQLPLTLGKPGQWVQYGLEVRATGQLVGDCALRQKEEEPRIGEIGISLSPAVQGQGYAREAMLGLMGILFDQLQVRRIEELTDAENLASVRMLESLGFRREAHFIENVFFKGKWGSEFIYAMLKREWETLKGHL